MSTNRPQRAHSTLLGSSGIGTRSRSTGGGGGGANRSLTHHHKRQRHQHQTPHTGSSRREEQQTLPPWNRSSKVEHEEDTTVSPEPQVHYRSQRGPTQSSFGRGRALHDHGNCGALQEAEQAHNFSRARTTDLREATELVEVSASIAHYLFRLGVGTYVPTPHPEEEGHSTSGSGVPVLSQRSHSQVGPTVTLGSRPGLVRLESNVVQSLYDGVGVILVLQDADRKLPIVSSIDWQGLTTLAPAARRHKLWQHIDTWSTRLLGMGISSDRKYRILCGDVTEVLNLLHNFISLLQPHLLAPTTVPAPSSKGGDATTGGDVDQDLKLRRMRKQYEAEQSEMRKMLQMQQEQINALIQQREEEELARQYPTPQYLTYPSGLLPQEQEEPNSNPALAHPTPTGRATLPFVSPIPHSESPVGREFDGEEFEDTQPLGTPSRRHHQLDPLTTSTDLGREEYGDYSQVQGQGQGQEARHGTDSTGKTVRFAERHNEESGHRRRTPPPRQGFGQYRPGGFVEPKHITMPSSRETQMAYQLVNGPANETRLLSLGLYTRRILVVQVHVRFQLSQRRCHARWRWFHAVLLFQARYRLLLALRRTNRYIRSLARGRKREEYLHRCRPIVDQFRSEVAFRGFISERKCVKYARLCCSRCLFHLNAAANAPLPPSITLLAAEEEEGGDRGSSTTSDRLDAEKKEERGASQERRVIVGHGESSLLVFQDSSATTGPGTHSRQRAKPQQPLRASYLSIEAVQASCRAKISTFFVSRKTQLLERLMYRMKVPRKRQLTVPFFMMIFVGKLRYHAKRTKRKMLRKLKIVLNLGKGLRRGKEGVDDGDTTDEKKKKKTTTVKKKVTKKVLVSGDGEEEVWQEVEEEVEEEVTLASSSNDESDSEEEHAAASVDQGTDGQPKHPPPCRKCKPMLDSLKVRMEKDHSKEATAKYFEMLCTEPREIGEGVTVTCHSIGEQLLEAKKQGAIRLFVCCARAFCFIARITPDISGLLPRRYPPSLRWRRRLEQRASRDGVGRSATTAALLQLRRELGINAGVWLADSSLPPPPLCDRCGLIVSLWIRFLIAKNLRVFESHGRRTDFSIYVSHDEYFSAKELLKSAKKEELLIKQEEGYTKQLCAKCRKLKLVSHAMRVALLSVSRVLLYVARFYYGRLFHYRGKRGLLRLKPRPNRCQRCTLILSVSTKSCRLSNYDVARQWTSDYFTHDVTRRSLYPNPGESDCEPTLTFADLKEACRRRHMNQWLGSCRFISKLFAALDRRSRNGLQFSFAAPPAGHPKLNLGGCEHCRLFFDIFEGQIRRHIYGSAMVSSASSPKLHYNAPKDIVRRFMGEKMYPPPSRAPGSTPTPSTHSVSPPITAREENSVAKICTAEDSQIYFCRECYREAIIAINGYIHQFNRWIWDRRHLHNLSKWEKIIPQGPNKKECKESFFSYSCEKCVGVAAKDMFRTAQSAANNLAAGFGTKVAEEDTEEEQLSPTMVCSREVSKVFQGYESSFCPVCLGHMKQYCRGLLDWVETEEQEAHRWIMHLPLCPVPPADTPSSQPLPQQDAGELPCGPPPPEEGVGEEEG